jgi:hypothetical protein
MFVKKEDPTVVGSNELIDAIPKLVATVFNVDLRPGEGHEPSIQKGDVWHFLLIKT